MKTKLRALTVAVVLMMANHAFAQDSACSSKLCSKKSVTTISNQIEIDPAQWATPGDETEVLRGITSIVKEKVCPEPQLIADDNRKDNSRPVEDAMESGSLN